MILSACTAITQMGKPTIARYLLWAELSSQITRRITVQTWFNLWWAPKQMQMETHLASFLPSRTITNWCLNPQVIRGLSSINPLNAVLKIHTWCRVPNDPPPTRQVGLQAHPVNSTGFLVALASTTLIQDFHLQEKNLQRTALALMRILRQTHQVYFVAVKWWTNSPSPRCSIRAAMLWRTLTSTMFHSSASAPKSSKLIPQLKTSTKVSTDKDSYSEDLAYLWKRIWQIKIETY